jgi:SAM-dependent methyltransferase
MTTETDRYNRYWRERRDTKYTPVRPRHKVIAEYIIKHSYIGQSVLDLGCGEGHILQRLPATLKRQGCDISPIPLSMVKDDSIQTVICDLNADWPDGLYFYKNFIIASELLEHMPSPEILLTKINQHLAAHGQFLCTIPNVWYWPYLWARLHGKKPNYDPTHCHFWTLLKFRRLLHRHGFQILSARPTIINTPTKLPKLLCALILRISLSQLLTGEQWLFVCRRKQ